ARRVDHIILCRRLTLPQIEKIVDLQVEELRHRLAERGTKLELNEDARRLIAAHGYDPVYGARPLRRYLAHELETRIGRALLSGELNEGASIRGEGLAHRCCGPGGSVKCRSRGGRGGGVGPPATTRADTVTCPHCGARNRVP